MFEGISTPRILLCKFFYWIKFIFNKKNFLETSLNIDHKTSKFNLIFLQKIVSKLVFNLIKHNKNRVDRAF